MLQENSLLHFWDDIQYMKAPTHIAIVLLLMLVTCTLAIAQDTKFVASCGKTFWGTPELTVKSSDKKKKSVSIRFAKPTALSNTEDAEWDCKQSKKWMNTLNSTACSCEEQGWPLPFTSVTWQLSCITVDDNGTPKLTHIKDYKWPDDGLGIDRRTRCRDHALSLEIKGRAQVELEATKEALNNSNRSEKDKAPIANISDDVSKQNAPQNQPQHHESLEKNDASSKVTI